MHHFIYPLQDTFITNTVGLDSLNFGLDETLRLGTQNITLNITSPTTSYPISQSVSNLCITSFSGSVLNASLYGTSSFSIGTISSSINENISSSNFTGTLTGSITGSSFTGSLTGFSGSFNGNFVGIVSGSLWTDYLGYFNGSMIGFAGQIVEGILVGYNTLPNQNTSVSENIYVNRILIQFDINPISKSISNGDIINPEFRLKLSVAREKNLPINYNIYAFPISESWVMGDGYLSDNGSTQGASWIYKDSFGGNQWEMTGSTYIQSLSVTQSFNYQVGDIDMDVTPIVISWLSGSIANNGILLISSDEFSPTGSGIGLYFFSKDTNTIYEPILDVGWNDSIWITGSITTSSINISTIPAGISGIVSDSSSISGSLFGGFTGVGDIIVETDLTASGLIDIYGTSGLILSMSIVGNISGSVSSSIVTVYKMCNSFTPNFNAGFGFIGGQDQSQYQGLDVYGWGNPYATFNQYDWWSDHVYQQEFGPVFSCGPYLSGSFTCSMVTMSFLMGELIDGIFSGSTFTSSFFNGYRLGSGFLVGTWDEQLINGTNISSSYPFKPMFPNAINVGFYGSYVNGNAFGSIINLSASMGLFDYGIFNGVFIDGPLVGMKIIAPFTGSILTSSYSYTSSINLISSSLTPVNFNKSFTTVLQDIQTTVKSGDIIRINVFARPEFPLKNFNRQTQFTQFLIPQYLPTSSYYCIKDNETEQTILDFDLNTKLSCDTNGNFFMLDTTSFPQERYFKILIRTENSGSIYTFDKSSIFKIVR